MKIIGHYIGGEQTNGRGDRVQDVFNPATGQATKQVTLATVEDVETAVAAASAAWPAWRKMPALRRARTLDRFKNIL